MDLKASHRMEIYIGRSPRIKRNLYIGAGFNAYGIAAGGGAGMALAEWVANGAPPLICGQLISVALVDLIWTQIGLGHVP